MAKFGNKRYFGLDIGESAIKLVEVTKRRDGFRLGMAKLIELDIDPVFDDTDKRNDIIKERLRQVLVKEGIDSGTVAVSISGQSVFIRPLKVPKIAKNKIEQIIQYEAQLQVPFPISDVIWSYELFETYDNPEMEVALVAVKRDIVEKVLTLLKDTGLEVDFVDIDPFSLFNIMDFVNGVKNKIILDIGAKITDIIIVAEEHKIWTRSILLGGNDLTKAISASLKLSFKDAEELKKKEGIVVMTEQEKDASPHAGSISDAISPVLIELLSDISKSIGYYKSQFGETKLFKEILITGGCSKLKNIAYFIRTNIDMPTRTLNLFDKISEDLDFKLTEDLIGRMDVGVGLALRTVTSLTTKTNLLPKEILQAKEFEKRKWYIFGSLFVSISILMTLSGFINWYNGKKSVALAKASSLYERYTRIHQEMGERQGEVNILRARLDFIANIPKARKRPHETLIELTKLLPDNLWLTGLGQEGEVLTLKGRAKGTFESIGKFKDALMESDYFKTVSIESADVSKDASVEEDIRAFTIKVEPYPLKTATAE
jgi:type IV pilus assembly protein PilM